MQNLIKRIYWKLKGLVKLSMSNGIDPSSYLANDVQILGITNSKIGRNCSIGEHTLITINHRSDRNRRLEIGNNVYIGRDNFFTIGGRVKIGDYCMFGNKCSFICSDHVFSNPLIPYALSGGTFEKQIIIGVNCWLGYNVSVIGNVSIGHGSVIGANSVVLNDIPPFSLAVGSPAKVIKRFDFETGVWIKDFVPDNSPYFDEQYYKNYFENNFKETPISYHSVSSKFGHL